MDRAEAVLQGLVDGDRQEPAALVDGDAPAREPALADDRDEEVYRLITVGVDFGIGDEGVGDEVEIFELPDHEGRLALDRQHQGLEGVVARRLLAGEVEDVLRPGHHQDVEAAPGEGRAGGRDAAVVFGLREGRLLTPG